MRKVPFIALALLGVCAAPARALDIKNIRSTYGPFGSIRADNKLLQGDILFLSFELENIKMEAQSGLVRYTIALEVLDAKEKAIFKRPAPNPNQRHLALGKSRLSERAQVYTGTDQEPGKYSVRLTVVDVAAKDAKGKLESKSFTYDFEIAKADFGLIHLNAPSVTVVNQEYTAQCALIGMARDAKMMPNVEVRMRILDEKGKATLSKPFVLNIPQGLPEDLGKELDIKKAPLIPLPFPIYLNRAGRFTVEIVADDAVGKKSTRVSFPLLVLETSSVGAP